MICFNMTDKELLIECQVFLEHIINNIGEITTEYTWRDATALSSMISDSLVELDEF